MANTHVDGTASRASGRSPWIRPFGFGLAFCCVAAGASRIAIVGTPDQDALLFFLGGLACVLADSISKLKIGTLEFEILEKKVSELAKVTKSGGFDLATTRKSTSKRVAASGPKADFDATLATAKALLDQPDLTWNDDPLEELNAPRECKGGALTAQVRKSELDRDLFAIDVTITLSPALRVEEGTTVALLLHHSFRDPVRRYEVARDTLQVSLLSAGSFTLAAVLPDGSLLRLDLAKEADLGSMSEADQARFRLL